MYSNATDSTKSNNLRLKHSQKQKMQYLKLIFIFKKCVQPVFYFLTAAKKRTAILPVDSFFLAFASWTNN